VTRKNMKGIVGKKNPTTNHKEDTGVGISFTQEHVSYNSNIESVVKKKKKEQGLE